MALSTPQIFTGKIMHKRLFPRENGFTYSIYYLKHSIMEFGKSALPYNRAAPLCFWDKHHGACDGSNLESWVRDILSAHKIPADGDIQIITMPQILGYVFNPVSFWLCLDKEGMLRAVLCEVHNTFGEKHSYICAHSDHRPIERKDVLKAEKVFHVSPMFHREGYYTFRFDSQDDKFGAWIDYFDGNGEKQLVTSLIGTYQPLTKRSLRKVFWAYPLITLKTIALIHWQALKLLSKSIEYISKPKQKDVKVSASKGLKKI